MIRPIPEIINAINSFIKTNNNREITAAVLNPILIDSVESLNGLLSDLAESLNDLFVSWRSKISDADGDTYISTEETPDGDLIVIKINKTGTQVSAEYRNGNNLVVKRIYGNGETRILHDGGTEYQSIVNGKGFQIFPGIETSFYTGYYDYGVNKTIIYGTSADLRELVLKMSFLGPHGGPGIGATIEFLPGLSEDITKYGKLILTNNQYNKVGIGTSTPSEKVEITGGTLKTEGLRSALSTKTANYKLTKSDERLILNANSNPILVELIDVSTANHGQIYWLMAKNNSVNLITVVAFEDNTYDITDIADRGGTIFRYTITNGSISGLSVGSYIKISNAAFSFNNGTFAVVATNSSNYFDIVNISGVTETTSPAKYQKPVFDADMSVNEIKKLQCDNSSNTYINW
jgi:hypothetical protein